MKRFVNALMRQERILGGAAVLASLQLIASFMGLIRDRALVKTFSNVEVVDVYISSFRISDLLFQMLIMSAFSVAMVPLLVEKKQTGGVKLQKDFLLSVTAVATVAFLALSIVVWVTIPWLSAFVVDFQGSALELYIKSARLALLNNALFVVGNAFGQYLIAAQRYVWYGLTPVLYTLGTILGTLYLSSESAFGELGPMAGSILGAVLYAVCRMLAALKHLNIAVLPIKFITEDFRQIIQLMLPRMFALGALQFQFLVFDGLASGLAAGSITINAYARNFQSVTVGVVGIALAQSTFALLSKAATNKDSAKFWLYLRKGMHSIFGLTIPAALALVLLTPIAAYIIGLQGSTLFILVLALYSLSIPFESANHLVARAFYSTKESILPSLLTVISGALSIVCTWGLMKSFGIFALPAGFALAQIVLLISSVYILQPLIHKRLTSSKHL